MDGLNKSALWSLHVPAPSAALQALIQLVHEERLAALGKTIASLKQRLGNWAKDGDKSRRASYRDCVLLNSFELRHINPKPFSIPDTAKEYTLEWVRCCLFCARLVLVYRNGSTPTGMILNRGVVFFSYFFLYLVFFFSFF